MSNQIQPDVQQLSVGEEVVILHGYYSDKPSSSGIVEKIGKIHVTINGDKYRIEGGRKANSHFVYFRQATPDDKKWLKERAERKAAEDAKRDAAIDQILSAPRERFAAIHTDMLVQIAERLAARR